jgi:hypothetical protein
MAFGHSFEKCYGGSSTGSTIAQQQAGESDGDSG